MGESVEKLDVVVPDVVGSQIAQNWLELLVGSSNVVLKKISMDSAAVGNPNKFDYVFNIGVRLN